MLAFSNRQQETKPKKTNQMNTLPASHPFSPQFQAHAETLGAPPVFVAPVNKVIYVCNPGKPLAIVAIATDARAHGIREYLNYARKDKADSFHCESVSDFLSDESGRLAWGAFQSTMR